MNAGDVSGSVALDSVSSVTFTQDTDGTIILHCTQNDEGPIGSDEEPEPIHKRLRLSSEETEDPASTPSAYSVVALPLSEREESFEVTMTATEMKDDPDQESEDQLKQDEKLSPSRKSSDVTAVSQAWFTTKEDKNTLVNKGHKWKQGMWSKEEIDILMSNIENYLKNRGIQDPSEIIFEMSKEERKDFYRSIAWGLNRPLFAVYRRVLRMYDNRNHVGKYTQEEIEKLKELRQKHGNDWATIGAALGRSASSVKDRCRLMKDTCHTGKWTEEEERRLTEVVHELTGTVTGDVVTQGVSWASVADLVGTRSEKQCRSKWLNYLNWKQSGGTDWTKEDDINLINRIIELSVEDENEINWDILAEGWSSVRSPQWLRSKWWTIKRQVSNHKDLPFPVLLKGLQDVVEAPSSTVNKVVVVGSRSVHGSSSPVTALQIPVQIPVQITHISSSDSTSGSSESGTITLNSGALQTFELLPSFHLQPTGTPGTYFLQTGSNQNLPLTLSANSTVTLAAAGSPGSPEQIILHSLAGDSMSDNVTVQMSHPGIIIQTVTSEDLPDPLNQSELTSERDLANEEGAEEKQRSKEGESNEQSSKVVREDATYKSLKLKEEAVNSGIVDSTVLIVPSPSSFIPTSDITTDAVLPVGTLTDPILQNQEEGSDC
ncbi:cyclin-D-binding Myb-like transcription factor 1 isoform X1 [Tachysurus fulvidraco]|uniref:cyclin-D-binding Myb-like transcription factor 1 isoform X1 n=1 Tax=Tachysurus fulvidraco TaxID=1234273 RepID=UPI001FEDC55E|nr:cyclin-D-binding Myb-like transcription factor 1 isoform X1 [Tachysurus fulvidraco]XP_027007395.2 cyclin-D-binding Myb-like transcription factor 1 isoform X1 [Tachysurus fulvidraco]XP_047660158.1 cyclin-D-binding Myb-like transcription factor 1 isoform X1 [Tachysurus fulvidraco]